MSENKVKGNKLNRFYCENLEKEKKKTSSERYSETSGRQDIIEAAQARAQEREHNSLKISIIVSENKVKGNKLNHFIAKNAIRKKMLRIVCKMLAKCFKIAIQLTMLV